jgi:hypothetical protein
MGIIVNINNIVYKVVIIDFFCYFVYSLELMHRQSQELFWIRRQMSQFLYKCVLGIA